MKSLIVSFCIIPVLSVIIKPFDFGDFEDFGDENMMFQNEESNININENQYVHCISESLEIDTFEYYMNYIEDKMDEFCEIDGYFVSVNSYTHDVADFVCRTINKRLIRVNDENFNEIGDVIKMCNNNELKVWIEDINNSCASYNIDYDLCGTIYLTNPNCDETMPVICH